MGPSGLLLGNSAVLMGPRGFLIGLLMGPSGLLLGNSAVLMGPRGFLLCPTGLLLAPS